MCRILDNSQVVFFGNAQDLVHIAWLASHMNRNDRLGFWRNCGFEPSWIEIESVALAVHKHRFGFEVENDLRRRGKRHGRNDDLVTFFNSDGVQRQMKRRGSGIHRHRMLAPHIPGEILFEALDLGTGRKPSGLECLNDRTDLILADRGLMKRNEFDS